ncbi:MAG: hypothetical protein WBG65_14220 [Sulfurimonadaceae bacterium]
MRLSVFTNTKLFTLEESAKDIFMNLVLTPDDNNQVLPVQELDDMMMLRAKNLTLGNGMDEIIKNEIIEAFEDLKEGDRFLMNQAFITDIKSAEAAYYWRIVALLNDGSKRTATEAQGIARMGEREFDVRYKEQEVEK